jgi:predicted NAD/FAD-dependent oxidoreductase
MSESRIAVIGAGMAGLACARGLFAASREVSILEKSRGLGGRLATRRIGRLAFDHGAQYVIARESGLQDYLDLACATGHAHSWLPVAPGLSRTEPWYVGAPGMSSLVQPLAAGLDVRRGVRVVACAKRDTDWWLQCESGDELGPFEALVFAIPAPQALDLTRDLNAGFDIAARLNEVRMAPCWAVLAGFPERLDSPADIFSLKAGPLAWAARDVSKPGRKSPHDCWVFHASAEWTQEHIDDTAAKVAAALLLEFGKLVDDAPAPNGAHLVAHLWRYARVEKPLGEPCLWDPVQRLGFCGDWCMGPRVEAAWISGTTLAQRILTSL